MFDKLRIKYLKDKGMLCPYCDSNDLTTGNSDFSHNAVTQDVKCLACNKSWTDTYILYDVTFEDETK